MCIIVARRAGDGMELGRSQFKVVGDPRYPPKNEAMSAALCDAFGTDAVAAHIGGGGEDDEEQLVELKFGLGDDDDEEQSDPDTDMGASPEAETSPAALPSQIEADSNPSSSSSSSSSSSLDGEIAVDLWCSVAPLVSLFVEPAERRYGIGDALFRAMLRESRRCGYKFALLKAEDNGSGKLIKWYENMGFALLPDDNTLGLTDGAYMVSLLPVDPDDEYYMGAIRAVASTYDGNKLSDKP